MQFRPTNSMFEIFRTRSILRPCNIDARLLRKTFPLREWAFIDYFVIFYGRFGEIVFQRIVLLSLRHSNGAVRIRVLLKP